MVNIGEDQDDTRKRDSDLTQAVAIEREDGDTSGKETTRTGAPSDSKQLKVDTEAVAEPHETLVQSQTFSQVSV